DLLVDPPAVRHRGIAECDQVIDVCLGRTERSLLKEATRLRAIHRRSVCRLRIRKSKACNAQTCKAGEPIHEFRLFMPTGRWAAIGALPLRRGNSRPPLNQ